jgi:hypothetical protein
LQSLTVESARAIGNAARRRILNQHTYAHRALQLQDILDGRFTPATTTQASSFLLDPGKQDPIPEVSA